LSKNLKSCKKVKAVVRAYVVLNLVLLVSFAT
jgi:hypothetical protein